MILKSFLNFFVFLKKLSDAIFNRILLKHKNAEFTTPPIINGRVFIIGKGKLIFEDKVQINSSLKSNPIGGDTKFIVNLGEDGFLKIGENSGISNATIICHKKVVIGRYVKIGGSVKIYDTDFHNLNYIMRQNHNTDIAKKKAIFIEDNVFIGAHSIILKGVTIGENSIIGAGSLVTKSIPPNQIWAGNPAKFIKDI